MSFFGVGTICPEIILKCNKTPVAVFILKAANPVPKQQFASAAVLESQRAFYIRDSLSLIPEDG
jgi:hypothetical protein